MRIANFQEDLQRGHEGELSFQKIFPLELERLDGRIADFRIKASGELIELKTEYRDSPNVFLERWSNWEYKTSGGPWRAKCHDIDYVVHYFPRMNHTYHVYSVEALIGRLECLENSLRPYYLPNSTAEGVYYSMGYAVSKTQLCDLEIKSDWTTHAAPETPTNLTNTGSIWDL